LFGVDVGQVPWQRRLEEIGGIKPRWSLVSLGRWGPASRRSLLAWRNEGRMRWRVGISSKTARRQSSCGSRGADVSHAAALGCCGGVAGGGRKRRSSLVG
jgi:hypothetical protein